MRTSIWLKFGTCIGGLKANDTIIIEVNLIKNEGVKRDFTQKARTNFCHAYRVNHFKEQAENQCLATLNIKEVLE